MKKISKKIYLSVFLSLFIPVISFAEADVSISSGDVYLGKKNMKVGDSARVYAIIRNNGDQDMSGTIRFIEEHSGKNLAGNISFSTLAGKTDDVFFDLVPNREGEYKISIKLFPENSDSNSTNNQTTKVFFAGKDFDNDGILDKQDIDIDGDGVHNQYDAFPWNAREYLDTDGDKKGNNTDIDDDNDGLTDTEELEKNTNPLKPDTDGDGVSDKDDLYPHDPNNSGDFDNDGIGDRDDKDDDNDGVPDEEDSHSKNHGPELSIKFPDEVLLGELVHFDASDSRDVNGSIARVQWFFGDEILEGIKVSKIFGTIGLKKINVKIFDNNGESRKEVIFVTVSSPWALWKQIFMGITLFLLLWLLLTQFRRFKQDKNG